MKFAIKVLLFYRAFSFAMSKFRAPSNNDRPDFCSILTMLERVENEAGAIVNAEEGLNVAMQLGAPLDEGTEMYVELQNKHQDSKQ